ncbi:uncharacterized protein LOC115628943 [Scaptodrosophila lebanonensis]|uniref:Uncharacterized protein LOC115628943 n=1 Tax=Drosophila lebanonensis TaxID=7225 RepID=A0A6J2TX15_DROLE|nr:uncharacterized protein LOC115628943 [Scaptodrosophila lebanonensis]
MCASVCVIVTVPTEEEERRLHTCRCRCGRSYIRRDYVRCRSESGTGDEFDGACNMTMCEHCWRLTQLDLASMYGKYGRAYATPMSGVSTESKPPKVVTKTTGLIGTTTSTGSSGIGRGDDEASVARPERCRRTRTLRLGLSDGTPLEVVLRTIVEQLHLENVFWSKDVEGRHLQARFNMQMDERYECLLCTLQDWGVGERLGTRVEAMNCLDTRAYAQQPSSQGLESTTWETFMDSVRCRLNVNQVVRQVSRDATLTFDFVVLLIAAALLACVGLVEDSFLFMSSSMLISPLMGPIIAGVFGTVIGDHNLRWLGMKNELFGIAIAATIGFIFGGVVCVMGHFFAISRGLTAEILSRCDTHSLAMGIFTALASGAAGAIGILGGNTGSLVGVAISASLLPPAVNSGLLWALATGTRLMGPESALLQSLAKHAQYSKHLPIELFVCASISMGLTLLNIVCVWLMGVVVLRIKEVAPAVRRNHQFWRHDVKIARECAHHDPALQDAIDRLDRQKKLDQEGELDLNAPQYQHTWSPGTRHVLEPQATAAAATCSAQGNNYHTVHGFQEFCITLHKLNNPGRFSQGSGGGRSRDGRSRDVPESLCRSLPADARSTTPAHPISVMELFAQGPKGVTPTAIAEDTLSLQLEGQQEATSYRSMPDLSFNSPVKLWSPGKKEFQLLQLPQDMQRSASSSSDRIGRSHERKRSVHWSFASEHETEDEFPVALPPAPSCLEVAHVSSLSTSQLPSNSPEALKRNTGQVLLPLPQPVPMAVSMSELDSLLPNRRLRLLHENEANVPENNNYSNVSNELVNECDEYQA